MDTPNFERLSKLRRTGDGPFAWQNMKTIAYLRWSFTRKRFPTALAIYQAFTELASEAGKRRRAQTAIFSATHQEIAEKSRKSVSSVKRYANEFKKIGILDWDIKKRGKENAPNIWRLLKCPVQNSEPTPAQNGGLPALAQNSELPSEERLRKLLKKDRNVDNSKRGGGFKSIGETL